MSDRQEDIAWSHALQQHQDRPKIEALFKALLSPKSKTSDALERLLTALDLDRAQGPHLDYIGSIVGVTRDLPNGLFMAYFGFASQPAGRAFNTVRMRRDGETISTSYTAGDAEYRSLIRLKILMNNARGTAPEVIAAVRDVLGDQGLQVSVRQNGTGKAAIYIGKVPLAEDPTPQLLQERVPRPGGVAYSYHYYAAMLDADFTRAALPSGFTLTRANPGTVDGATGIEHKSANLPRFYYEPPGYALRGLLLEGPATNSANQSDNLASADWPKFNITMAVGKPGPDGGTGAADMLLNAGVTSGNFRRSNIGVLSNAPILMSLYLQPGLDIALAPNASLVIQAYENGSVYKGGLQCRADCTSLSAPAHAKGSATLGAWLEPAPGGWWRLSWLFQPNGSALPMQMRAGVTTNGVTNATATALVRVWGPMFDQTQLPSSYVLSQATAMTRPQEEVSAALSTWFNEERCTIVAEIVPMSGLPAPAASSLLELGTATDNVKIRLAPSGGLMKIGPTITRGGAVQWEEDLATVVDRQLTRIGLAYSASGGSFAVNGDVLSNFVNPISLPRGMTGMKLAPAYPLILRRLTVYPRRVTGVELEQLTSIA